MDCWGEKGWTVVEVGLLIRLRPLQTTYSSRAGAYRKSQRVTASPLGVRSGMLPSCLGKGIDAKNRGVGCRNNRNGKRHKRSRLQREQYSTPSNVQVRLKSFEMQKPQGTAAFRKQCQAAAM